jgi:cytochrome c peroxidase
LAWTFARAALVPLFILLAAAQAQAQQKPTDLAALKAGYARPAAKPVENPPLVELGRLLFWDPRVSASGKTACVSCHYTYIGWASTDPRNRNDSGKPTSRKSQPLLGMGHMEDVPFGWDGRNPTLEAQAKNSVVGGSMSMPGKPVNIDSIAFAIAAYERTIEPGVAPFDRWVGGDEAAISESAKRGFALFNGKANCNACHVGWRLTDDGFHDIGTSKTDRGRGREMKDIEPMQFAFKTPTLRSVALRPPYMHNGSSATLYDVVRHYESGGIDRPSRSPEIFALALSEAERLDLVAFMQTLTGVPEGESAPKLPPKLEEAK